ncbi:hypothetical protein BGZ99_010242 [Dissophora globulifera]|uniref:Uncharacterized protein n=1 Tax=Dissophora globulifera TaxID=979702 RepID=A0A9P6RSS4_9FUNG|nr:hypothetical protein BGZ99_010242 [Dissophora globulifera]
MASAKQRRSGARSNSTSPPSSSPHMPPAPILAQNRGSASPRHTKDDVMPTAPAIVRTRSGRTILSETPPAAANSHDLVHAAVPLPHAKSSVRRIVARLLLIYVGYTVFFVCPSQPNSQSNAICENVLKVQEWLHPYSDPVAHKLDETYRTYAEPYIDQYGRPLYKTGEKYYVDIAQPAMKTASNKARQSYNQYAQPHVNRAVDTVYTDNVKAHVKKAQANWVGYQKQAHSQIQHVRKMSEDAQDQLWQQYDAHVHPAVTKISPYAKVYWDRASSGAIKAYDTAGVYYMTHLNPYAQQTFAVVLDAAENAKESFAKHTDEIWGTRFSKHNKSKVGRTAGRADKKAKEIQKKVEEAARAAEKKAALTNADADAKIEGVKDKLLKMVTDTQKLAEDYVESARDTFQDTVAEVQKVAGDYSESIKAAVHAATPVETKKSKANDIKDAIHEKAEAIKAAVYGKKATDKKQSAMPSAEEIKDAIQDKVAGAQKIASDYSQTVMEAVAGMEGVKVAKKVADNHIPSSDEVKAAAVEKGQNAQKVAMDEAESLRALADKRAAAAGKMSAQVEETIVEKAHEAQEAVSQQAENVRLSAQEAGANVMETVRGMVNGAKESVEGEAEHIANLAKEMKDSVEHLSQQAAAAIKGSVLEKEKEAKDTVDDATLMAQRAFHTVEQGTDSIKAKVIDSKKATEQNARGKVESARKAAKDMAQEQADWIRESTDQFVMGGSEKANKAKEYVVEHAKGADEQVKSAKETVKHKAHDAQTASKATLAAMLAGIETTFGKFYEYEDAETKNLWSKLQSAIDEHIDSAKTSASNLEKANREAYDSFESYVRDWKHQGGELEDRLSKLSERSVDSIKMIGLRAEEDQKAAKSKAQTVANNVEVYLVGLKDFLADRLAASKETVVSDLSVFKDTSSENDEKTVRNKLTELEQAARSRLESAGLDARTKAQQLMKQVDEIWSQSEKTTLDYVQRTHALANQAREEAKTSIKSSTDAASDKVETIKSKIHSTNKNAQDRVQDTAGKVRDAINQKMEQEPNVRIAQEEPGSGHRHHRH